MWKLENKIFRVVILNGFVKQSELEDMDDWVYEPRFVGSKIKKIQIFLTAEKTLSIKELVDKQLELC